jgi:hypothetical protein
MHLKYGINSTTFVLLDRLIGLQTAKHISETIMQITATYLMHY